MFLFFLVMFLAAELLTFFSLFPQFNSSSCVPSRYQKISQSVILEEAQLLPVTPGFPLIHAFSTPPVSIPPTPQPRPPTLLDSSAELILLQAPQVRMRSNVQTLNCVDSRCYASGEQALLFLQQEWEGCSAVSHCIWRSTFPVHVPLNFMQQVSDYLIYVGTNQRICKPVVFDAGILPVCPPR